MGWFSRRRRDEAARLAPVAQVPPVAAQAQGRFGPRVRLTALEGAPVELTWQLPLRGELHRLMPGPDRPDYSLMLLERPLLFYPTDATNLERVSPERLVEDRRGRRMVEVHALVLTARFVGQQLHPGMVDLPVNVAYVMDQSLAQDESVDPEKIAYAAVGHLTEEREADGATSATSAATPEPETTSTASGGDVVLEVGHEVARLLRQGVADLRGSAVDRLTATVTIDFDNRISGLSGNADGSAPEPTPETFERINAALSRLGSLPPERAVSVLSLSITGDDVTVETSG